MKKERTGSSVPRFVSPEIWRDVMLTRTFKAYDERQRSLEAKGVTVHVPETETTFRLTGLTVEEKISRPGTKSERVLRRSELGNVWIKYKTGDPIKANVKYSPDRSEVWLEPVVPNRASIVMEEKDLIKDVDLSKIPHLRVYHSPKNNQDLREWFPD